MATLVEVPFQLSHIKSHSSLTKALLGMLREALFLGMLREVLFLGTLREVLFLGMLREVLLLDVAYRE